MIRTLSLFMYAISLLLLIAPLSKAQSRPNAGKHRVVDWAGGYFAPFVIVGDLPDGFKDFDTFIVEYLPNQEGNEQLLMPDKHGFIPTTGELITRNKIIYKFKNSRLIENGRSIELSFVTESVEGVSYSFKGEYFYDAKEIRAGDKIVGYVELEGVLTKFNDGRKAAQAKIGLEENVQL
jgi:hypothetical protein